MGQKYHLGDLVQIADDLGPSMSHFTSGVRAIVMYSYEEKYRGSGSESYSLWIEGHGETAWYDGADLTLIEKHQYDLLEAWKRELHEKNERESDLDWIFEHGEEVLKNAQGATVEALAQCFTNESLWGSRGEGITYYMRAMQVLTVAEPFLLAGDKAGWLEACAKAAKAAGVEVPA